MIINYQQVNIYLLRMYNGSFKIQILKLEIRIIMSPVLYILLGPHSN